MRPSKSLCLALCVLGLALVPPRGTAQVARSLPPAPTRVAGAAPGLVHAGDIAHTALRPLDALSAFERAIEADPTDAGALWRAAREAVNLGMLAADGGDRKRRYAEAVAYARRARDADPTDPRTSEWLAIALGRQALEEGPRTRVRLAVEIREVALETLALDSLNAGAHHVLGAWNMEIRRLSGVERWFARKLLGGGVFDQATWEDAEYHLIRAIELDPPGLVHYLDLARLYVELDREGEARPLLREVLERSAVEPVDPLHKQAAQELLRHVADTEDRSGVS